MSGEKNVAAGPEALLMDTTGTDNVAAGSGALLSNTEGSLNVAIGSRAMWHRRASHAQHDKDYRRLLCRRRPRVRRRGECVRTDSGPVQNKQHRLRR